MNDFKDKEQPNQKRLFTVIFLIAFLNLIGFGMIIPLLPYYAKTFAASTVDVGLLVSSYAIAQFIGAPIWGRISDRYGRRMPLLISHLGAIISYIIFGLANTLWLLFASRIFGGVMNGNISVAQAYISDITGPRDRAKGLGIIGAAFGLGFVFGPVLGGILSQWGYDIPAYAAALLNFINLFAIYYLLPESLILKKKQPTDIKILRLFDVKALQAALIRPLVGPLLSIRFFFSLAFSTFTTVFAIYAEDALHLTAQVTSYILAYVGLIIIFVQGVLIGKLTRRFTEGALIFHSIWLMVLGLALWAVVNDVTMLMITMIPLAVASGIFNTVINSTLSKAVVAEEMGGILGLSASLDSFTRIIAPTAGGILLAHVGPFAPGIASALLLGAFLQYSWKHFYLNSHPALNSNLQYD